MINLVEKEWQEHQKIVQESEILKGQIAKIGELLCEAVVGSKTEFEFPSGDDKYIIAAHELTPVDTMLFDRSRIAGLVTELGGATSHTVILAKSLGIPAVVGVSGILESETDTAAYLDGYSGKVTF